MHNAATPSAAAPLKVISSMATRLVLTELLAEHRARSAQAVVLESVGGVDAAQRVRAGEAFDGVVLAADAMAQLAAEGHVRSDSVTPLVHSGVAVAVRAGSPVPDIETEAALRQAVLTAPSLSYSTGPSGVALAQLFARWGIAEVLRPRIVTPPPGVPVGSLVAKGEVALGFQQLSELIHVPGITLVGPLPSPVQITTTFSAGVTRVCAHPEAVRALLDFLASPDAAAAKQRQGMVPA